MIVLLIEMNLIFVNFVNKNLFWINVNYCVKNANKIQICVKNALINKHNVKTAIKIM